MNTAAATTESIVPVTQAELCRVLADNASGAGHAVMPVGGRTATDFGRPVIQPVGRPVQTVVCTELNRIIDYPARDMTVTVEAGIRINELAAVLAKENQRLAVDIPQPDRATLGGAIACDAAGPRRYGMGKLRDYVIGLSAVDASGVAFKAGGRVVKNVAGYDLCKAVIGSLGTLAVVSQVTLKLKPLPESTPLLWASFDSYDQIEAVLKSLVNSAARPVAIDVLDPAAASELTAEAALSAPIERPVLCIGVEGTQRESLWQLGELQREVAVAQPAEMTLFTKPDEAARLWSALTEFQTPGDEPCSFSASLLPSHVIEFMQLAVSKGVMVQSHAASGVVVGQISEEMTKPADAVRLIDELRKKAECGHGTLTVTHCEPAWRNQLDLFGRYDGEWTLMRRLKQTFDPRGLLSPGRLFGDL